MMRGRLSKQAGLSLLEVTLALAVLAFGIAGAVDLAISTQRASKRTQQSMDAFSLARSQAEVFKAAGFAAVAAQMGAGASAVYPSAPVATVRTAESGSAQRPLFWQTSFTREPGASSAIHVVTRVWLTPDPATPPASAFETTLFE